MSGDKSTTGCSVWLFFCILGIRYVGEMALVGPNLRHVQLSVIDFWGNREVLHFSSSLHSSSLKLVWCWKVGNSDCCECKVGWCDNDEWMPWQLMLLHFDFGRIISTSSSTCVYACTWYCILCNLWFENCVNLLWFTRKYHWIHWYHMLVSSSFEVLYLGFIFHVVSI